MERFFPDFTQYDRGISPCKLHGVINIGWIDTKLSFPQRKPSAELTKHLMNILESAPPFIPFMEPIRALPKCDLCGDIKYTKKNGTYFLDSELWIPTPHKIYASPLSVIHYIMAHDYHPPEEYIEAILSLDTAQEFDSNKIYKEKLLESGWYDIEL